MTGACARLRLGLPTFPIPAALKVTTALRRLEGGNVSALKAVGRGVHEARVDFGPGYRVYLGVAGARTGHPAWRKFEGTAGFSDCGTPRHNGRIIEAGRVGNVNIKGLYIVPLTKEFRETVKARADRSPAYRAGLYTEAVQAMLDGDFPTGRLLLRDFINATIGFSELASALGTSDKSLMRMFGPEGNPRAENLLAVLRALKDLAGLLVTVETKAAPPCRQARKTAAA